MAVSPIPEQDVPAPESGVEQTIPWSAGAGAVAPAGALPSAPAAAPAAPAQPAQGPALKIGSAGPAAEQPKKIVIAAAGAPSGILASAETEDAVARTDFALGDTSPGKDILRAQYKTGTVDQTRRSTTITEALKDRKERMAKIGKITAQAAKEQRPLSAEDQQQLMELSKEELADPSTIIEKLWAKKMVELTNSADDPDNTNLLRDASEDDHDGTNNIINTAQYMAERQAIAWDVLSRAQTQYKNTSWLRYGWDVGKTAIPLYSWFTIRNNMEDASKAEVATGSNIQAQIEAAYMLPPKQFKEWAEKSVNQLMSQNSVEGLRLAQAIISYGNTNKIWDNVWNVVDAASAPAMVTGLARGAGAVAQAGKYAADAARIESTVGAVRGAPLLRKAGENASRGFVNPPRDAASLPPPITPRAPEAPPVAPATPAAAAKAPTKRELARQRTEAAVKNQQARKKSPFNDPEEPGVKFTGENVDTQSAKGETPSAPAPTGMLPPEGGAFIDNRSLSVNEIISAQRVLGETGIPGDVSRPLSVPRGDPQLTPPGDVRTPRQVFTGENIDTPAAEFGPRIEEPPVAPTGLPVTSDASKAVNAPEPSGVKELTNLERLAQRLRTSVSSQMTMAPKLSDVYAAAGNIRKAAEKIADDRLTSLANPKAGTDPKEAIATYASGQPSFFDPRGYARNVGSMANEQANRLVASLTDNAANLQNIWNKVAVLPRVVDPVAKDLMYANARKTWAHSYHQLEDTIIDTVPENLSDEVFGGVDRVAIYLGWKDASPFARKEQAENMAANVYNLMPGSYEVVPWKGSYAIRMTQTVDETEAGVRMARIGTAAPPPNTFAALWQDILTATRVNAIRTPKDTLSRDANAARAVLTYGGNEAVRYMKEAAESLGDLTKVQKSRQAAILNENRLQTRQYKMPDGTTRTLPGNWYDTFGDFERAYQRLFNELPDPVEVEAYFTFRQIDEWDWQTRNIGIYRDKARQGFTQASIQWPKSGEAKVASELEQSGFFEAKTLDTLPHWDTEPFTIAFVDDKGKKQLMLSSKMFAAQRKYVEDAIASKKLRVVQPLNPYDASVNAMTDAGGTAINYVLARNVKTKPLSQIQTEYRYGLHTMFSEDGRYIKQTGAWRDKFGRRTIGHDRTLTFHAIPAQAGKFVKSFNEAREMVIANVPKRQLDDYVTKNLPFRSGDEFKKIFRDPLVKGSTGFDINTPFVVTRAGERASDVTDLRATFKEEIFDPQRSEHNALNGVNTRFANELYNNQLNAIEETGTAANPVYKLTPAQQIDPWTAVQRSASELLNNRFMEDYKHMAVEDWATQFGHLMKATPEELRANPLDVLKNAGFKDGVRTGDKAAAGVSRRAILHLLAARTDVKDVFLQLRDRALDGAYKRWGVRGVKMIEPVLWTSKTDPSKMLRAAAFIPKLGLWNPRQLLLQAQGVITAAAIDGNPLRAVQANTLTFMFRAHRMGEFNPAYATRLGNGARKVVNMSPTEYKEMYEALKRSGMMNVQGEVSMLDDYFDPKIIQTRRGKAWASNTLFFREGERIVRMTAWNTAYLAWRAKNPEAKLTNAIERAIVDRADDLAMNMTRASNNPVWQGKIGGTITQFATFHARLSELMLGGRLTALEKGRMALTYSAMYGLPVGVGGTTVGAFLPVYEIYRKWAIENNVDMENPVNKMLLEGVPDTLLSQLFGEDLNFSENFGPAGLTFFSDLIANGDFSVFAGASGSVIADYFKSAAPFLYYANSLFTNDPKEAFKLRPADMIKTLREVSTVNNFTRAYMAWNYGMILTKGELVVDNVDVDSTLAAFMAITGLQPQSATDVWLKKQALEDIRGAKLSIEREAKVYWDRALRASQAGDEKEAAVNYQNASVIIRSGGFNPKELGDIMRRFMSKENEPIVDEVNRNWDKYIREHQEQQ